MTDFAGRGKGQSYREEEKEEERRKVVERKEGREIWKDNVIEYPD